MKEITLKINGESYTRNVRQGQILLHFLREEIGFTGAKEGCGAGECGACTIIMDGKTVNSCLVLAVEADGSSLTTIENEGKDGKLTQLQRAFVKHQAVQCGYCTAGMIMSIKELLQTNQKPSIEEIKEQIEGNFCRCTGYEQIIDAVLDVTGQLDSKEGGLLCTK